MSAKFDGKHRAVLTIKSKHGPAARGLCGNCDGVKNDYVTKEGVDVSQEEDKYNLIGDSWLVYNPDDEDKK